MASFTIIPYNPIQANTSHHPRTKYVSKPINGYDKGPRIKPSILLVDAPQQQAIAVANNAGLTTCEKDSNSISDGDQGSYNSVCTGQSWDQACDQNSKNNGVPTFISVPEEVSGAENTQIELNSFFNETDDIIGTKNGFMTEADNTFAKANTESKVSGAEAQDSDTECRANDIKSGLRDIQTVCHPLKRKAMTGRQGSKDNPLVVTDNNTESKSNSDSEDRFVWKKRKVGHPLVGRQVKIPWVINETDDEVDDTKFDIGCTRVRAGDTQSENDGVASEIGDSEGNEQSYPHPAASSTHHSDFASTLLKSADCVESQLVAKMGVNNEWRIHGIIGKEVIEGKVYYCVDWEPTIMPLDELYEAELLVRKFEVKRQLRLKKAGNIRKNKYRSRPRKQI